MVLPCKTLLCNCFTFNLQSLLNTDRGHWVIQGWKKDLQQEFMDYSESFIFVPEGCYSLSTFLFQECLMLRNARDSSDKAVIFLIIAKLVQASSGTHAVSLATKGGIFHSSPAENSFFLILFYRHMWKWVTALHVTVFLSRKYWCICVRILTCTFSPSHRVGLQND